jgi:hypothetical protein
MRRRDFGTLLGGGLRSAVPAATECAGASIVSASGATITLAGGLHSLPR